MNIFATSRFTSPFSGLRIWNLAKKKSGILRLHQDEFDKSLSHFSRHSCWFELPPYYLDFAVCRLFWRSHNRENVGLFRKIFRRHALDVVRCHCIHFGFQLLI